MYRRGGAHTPNAWAAMFDRVSKVQLKITSQDQRISEYDLETTYFLTVDCFWHSIDSRLSQFRNLVKIFITNQPLKIFPPSLCDLKHLKLVRLIGCHLSTLPPEMARMKSLCTLDISRNAFTSLPEVLCEIQTLQKLDAAAQYPGLTTLPTWIVHSTIKYLNVASNKISCIPSCYLLVYWMYPELTETYCSYKKTQCLVLGRNRLDLRQSSAKPSNCNFSPQFDLRPSQLTLVSLAANTFLRSRNASDVSGVLPTELQEMLSNWRECDRCRRRFLFGVRTVRYLSWQGSSTLVNFEFCCCSRACAADPEPFGAPAKPRVPKSVLAGGKGKVLYDCEDAVQKKTMQKKNEAGDHSSTSLPFDPLTRPRVPLKTKTKRKKKNKKKKQSEVGDGFDEPKDPNVTDPNEER